MKIVKATKRTTNRDWLLKQANKDLAKLLGQSSLCDLIRQTDIGFCKKQNNCDLCIEYWLEIERKVSKQNDSDEK